MIKRIKNISLIFIASLIFVCSAFIFTGCGDGDDECKLYVFATKGGYVQVNNSDELVEFGDEGSKIFTFEEHTIVKLKAVADNGYRFVKWMYADDLDEKYFDTLALPEFQFNIDDDEVVVKAVFEVDSSVKYAVSYPDTMTGYSIVPETGYTTSVAHGNDFKFKVELEDLYSNSDIVVKANGNVLTDVNGVYTISDIKQNISIVVEGVTLNPAEPTVYAVFVQDQRVTLNPVSSATCEVVEGGSFTFTLELANGYAFGDYVIVRAGGKLLTANNGEYTVDNVTKNIEITVKGIKSSTAGTYVIVAQDDIFYITPVQGTCEVNEGDSFAFTITLASGYKFDSQVVVKGNGITLTSDQGKYTIHSVVTDVLITVSGIVADV